MIFLYLSFILGAVLVGTASVAAALLSRPLRTAKSLKEPSIQVLIPCHNEESRIEITLAALVREFAGLPIQPTIHIALDACTDQTEAAVRRWSGVLSIAISKFQNRSKWTTLSQLVAKISADCDWVVLIDAGIDFESGVFAALVDHMKDSNLSYVCPAYRVRGGSLLSEIFWKIESTLKQIENRAGGPISVHGATVAYRTQVIQVAFQKLLREGCDFRNDDVVIPLAARIEFSEMYGRYLMTPKVFDHAVHDRFDFKTQLNQRKRMVVGNLQWTRWLSHQSGVSSEIVALSLRRALRSFWVYILLFIFFAAYHEVGSWAWVVLLPVLLFRAAAIASFYSLYAFLLKTDQKQTAWK